MKLLTSGRPWLGQVGLACLTQQDGWRPWAMCLNAAISGNLPSEMFLLFRCSSNLQHRDSSSTFIRYCEVTVRSKHVIPIPMVVYIVLNWKFICDIILSILLLGDRCQSLFYHHNFSHTLLAILHVLVFQSKGLRLSRLISILSSVIR